METSEQCVKSVLKVKNKDKRTSDVILRSLLLYLWTDFTLCYNVPTVDFEQISDGCVFNIGVFDISVHLLQHLPWTLTFTTLHCLSIASSILKVNLLFLNYSSDIQIFSIKLCDRKPFCYLWQKYFFIEFCGIEFFN